jgi:hypothetical protein
MMPRRAQGPKHIQVGPGVDVAACGVRGSFGIANSQRQITCADCKAKYAARFKSTRVERERAARLVYFKARAQYGAE